MLSVIKSMIYITTTKITTHLLLVSCHCKISLFQLLQERGCQAQQAPHNLCWKLSPMLGGWRRTTSLIPAFGSNRHSREQHKYDHSWQVLLSISLTHTHTYKPKAGLEPAHRVCDINRLLEMSSLPSLSFLGESNYRRTVIYKYSKACQIEALRRELETKNVNHSLWSKSNHVHLPGRTCEHMCTVCLHTREWRREEQESTQPRSLYSPATAHQCLRVLTGEENKRPVFSFQQVILNSSQQNWKMWAIIKVILTCFL